MKNIFVFLSGLISQSPIDKPVDRSIIKFSMIIDTDFFIRSIISQRNNINSAVFCKNLILDSKEAPEAKMYLKVGQINDNEEHKDYKVEHKDKVDGKVFPKVELKIDHKAAKEEVIPKVEHKIGTNGKIIPKEGKVIPKVEHKMNGE